MNVSSISSSIQNVWDEIRQETMRNSQTSVPASDEKEATVSATQETQTAPATGATPLNLDGDSNLTALERIKEMQRRAKMASEQKNPATSKDESPSPVTSPLENVGPNAYEKLRINAGRTYIAQAANYNGGEASPVLNTSA